MRVLLGLLHSLAELFQAHCGCLDNLVANFGAIPQRQRVDGANCGRGEIRLVQQFQQCSLILTL